MISITNKCNNLDKPMEGSRFTFKFVSSLSIRPEKVNVPKSSLYIKSAKWLRYKNVTRNPKNIDDRCFQYAFALTKDCMKKSKWSRASIKY